MMKEETFKEALQAIKDSEKRIEEFTKVAKLVERPRRESKLSGEQQYYILLMAILVGAVSAVLLTLMRSLSGY